MTKNTALRTLAFASLLVVCWLTLARGQNPAVIQVADPCLASAIPKQQSFLNMTTATSSQIVSLAAGQTIYVCGWTATMTGTVTVDSFQFVMGTGANCATGPSIISPNYNSGILAAGATVVGSSGSGTVIFTAAGKALCVQTTSVATGPTVNIGITFVQQ